eukprot:CAMPEP_0113459696 /NCGR_PEP_ID=MMETSP0014_2-20120614/10593_1 /TAXON_ID=2857 /ORGANISM="Nitzschia sp." /LENGTH=280 /DNA_ID=CAMNT_0000351303 /DNA_START=167 /DNA_END=1009 /DNA_ORIENTATION=- /assembly_acc=CAM_ASM_000159
MKSFSTTSTSSLLRSASSPSSSSSSSPSRDSLAAIRRAKMNGDPANMPMRLSALCTVASVCFHAASDLDSGSRSSSKSIATPTKKRVMANNPESSKTKKKRRRRLSSCGCCCISCVSSSPASPAGADATTSKRQKKKKVSDHTSIGLKSGAVGGAAVVEDSPVLAKACINAPVADVDVQVGHDNGGDDVVSVTDEESSVSSRSVEYSRSTEQHKRTKSIAASAPTTATSWTRNSSSNIRSWHRPLPFPLRLPKPFEATGSSKTGRNGKKTLGPITATLIM